MSEKEKDVQEGERKVADGGEDGGGGGEEGRQLRPGAGDAQKVKPPVKLYSSEKDHLMLNKICKLSPKP